MAKDLYEDKIKIKDSELAEQNKWTDKNANAVKNAINDIDDRVISLENGTSRSATVRADWRSGFTFDCYGGSFPLGNTFYKVPSRIDLDPVILANPDATLDRIDIIGCYAPIAPETKGTWGVIQGDLATANLIVPKTYDPSTFFPVKQVIVRANASVPETTNNRPYSNTTLFNENTGAPNEADVTLGTNFAISTNDKQSGNYSIEGSNILLGNSTIIFDFAETVDSTTIDTLNIWVKLKSSYELSYFYVFWYNGSTAVKYSFFRTGQGGFDANNLSWQKITLDKTFLNLPASDITRITIMPYKSFTGLFIDNIYLNEGSAVDVPTVVETPNLQQVTEKGATTNIPVTINGGNYALQVKSDVNSEIPFQVESSAVSQTRLRVRNTGGGNAQSSYGNHIETKWVAGYEQSTGDYAIDNSFNFTATPKVRVKPNGDVIVNKLVKIGGTSSQFLMADGSVSTGGGGGTSEMDNMNNMTVSKTTPIDADNLTLWDSVSSSFKKLTIANLKTYLNGNLNITLDPSQITITTAISITTDTLGDAGKTQKEKNVIISNGVNAINLTVNGGTNFLASYLKHGTGAITFVQGSGRTLIQVDATAVLNGAVGSTATISSIGTTDYLRISNV